MKCTLELWLRGTLYITGQYYLTGWTMFSTFEEKVAAKEKSLKIAILKFETLYRNEIYKSGIYEIKMRIPSLADPSREALDFMTDKDLLKRATPYQRKGRARFLPKNHFPGKAS